MNKPSPQREPMSYVDTAWLRMERPTNLMMVCGVMMLAEKITAARLKEVLGTRLLRFPRFRQRVVEEGGSTWWETDPNFDLNWHVCHVALPQPGDKAALQELVSELASTPLDYSKARWQYHIVDNYEGGTAIILRIHHCYADGIALIHVLMSMTDARPGETHEPVPPVSHAQGGRGAWERLLGPVTEVAGDAIRLTASALKLGQEWINHPSRAEEYLRKGVSLAEEATRIALMTPDSDTRFKGELGVMKRVAWSAPLALDEVKAVATVLGCSINDVLVSVATGALRRYLIAQGDPIEGLEVRALVPVNLRPPGPVNELGNHFGLVFLSLPVGIEEPIERLFEVRRRMDELKASQQPLIAIAILTAMGAAPEAVKEKILEVLAANASAVVTNVAGPAAPRYFGGARITQQMFWVPQSGGIGLGISILSYVGQVLLGVITDSKRVPHPEDIGSALAPEFEELMLATLMQPWQRE